MQPLKKHIQFFEERCDSQLEVLVGSAVCLYYAVAAFREGLSADDAMVVHADHIHFNEPFFFSPTSNGCSVGFLTCQETVNGNSWDFACFYGNNNGDLFDRQKSICKSVIDIDGYGIHRHQRQWDEHKLDSCEMRAHRLPEERFSNVNEMAFYILYTSFWDCQCSAEMEPPNAPCWYHDDLILRGLHNSRAVIR